MRRAGVRYLLGNPLQVATAVVGLALGVAVVVGVDLAAGSARRAFRVAAEAVAGRGTHRIVGGPEGLPEGIYGALRREAAAADSAPVVEGFVSVPSRPGLHLILMGIDPFSDSPFRPWTPGPTAGIDLPRLLTVPGTILALPDTARELALSPGDRLPVEAGGRRSFLTLLGTIDPGDPLAREALRGVLVADIAAAQEVLALEGRLSRIDLALPEGEAGEAVRNRVIRLLPPGAVLLPAGARAAALDRMTRAFSLNLTALSLLALVVGMFLIFNTMTFFVLRRREILGILRALGATRGDIAGLVLGESLVLGAAGTAIGILAGAALGRGLLALVTRTINDLYFVVAVRDIALLPSSLVKGIALGLFSTVAAALPPALEASFAPPRAVMIRSRIEAQVRRLVPGAALGGALFAVAGGFALTLPGKGIAASFAALFAVVGGFALATPWLTTQLLRLAAPLLGLLFGVAGRMAARNVAASISRTGVAVAALVVAVSASVGVGVMVDSFRRAVVAWLDQSLRADVYVSSPGTTRGPGRQSLSPSLPERLGALPGVAAVTTARHLVLESEAGMTELFVADLPDGRLPGFLLKEGREEDVERAFHRDEAVLVSEPYAFRHDVEVGDRIVLRTGRGGASFPVAGIYFDYGSEHGAVAMSRDTYRRHWDDPSIDSVGVYLASGADAGEAVRRIRLRAGETGPAVVYSNRALRQASLAIFDRTFVVTRVLRMFAVLVAFAGILNALLAMQMERRREFALLRALGMTPGQAAALAAAETGLMGLVSGLLALPLGIAQALALVLVVMRRSFGWTMPIGVDPRILAQALLVALAAALLAGAYPALRSARAAPAEGLREE